MKHQYEEFRATYTIPPKGKGKLRVDKNTLVSAKYGSILLAFDQAMNALSMSDCVLRPSEGKLILRLKR